MTMISRYPEDWEPHERAAAPGTLAPLPVGHHHANPHAPNIQSLVEAPMTAPASLVWVGLWALQPTLSGLAAVPRWGQPTGHWLGRSPRGGQSDASKAPRESTFARAEMQNSWQWAGAERRSLRALTKRQACPRQGAPWAHAGNNPRETE